MKILSFDYNLEFGFAWITVEGQNEGDIWTIQCCLAMETILSPTAIPKFIPQINMGDCGHNWGQCGECNEKAFKFWGENRCMTALFNEAKLKGLTVI